MAERTRAVDEHLARGRLLEAAGDGEQRALARAARSHDRHQLAAVDRQVDVAERVDTSAPVAVDLRHLAQLEGAVMPSTSHGRAGRWPAAGGGAAPAGSESVADRAGATRPRPLSSQRTTASSRKSSASTTRASGTSSSAASRLDPGVVLHQLDQVPAVHLDHVVHVDARHLQGHQHLDHQLVARRRGQVGRGAQPRRPARRARRSVIRKPFCGPSSSSSDSTSPSRSSRCRVVYTCPTFSGQTSPVRASNSCRSWSPYLAPR